MAPDESQPPRSIARDVKANVIAGLIVAAILAAAGAAYSLARNLSLYQFMVFVISPAALIGILVSGVMMLRALSELFDSVIRWIEKFETHVTETNERLTAAEGRIAGQVSQLAYADVISEAEADGWKVERGDAGSLHFSHPEWGTCGTGGGDSDLDPDRLRLLLSVGRGGGGTS